ncbi:MAG: hypothetical protein GQ564_07555, partial [Bacteroidales bacterium]|nr:hypothetical protein [Bacteroidales bacterium]
MKTLYKLLIFMLFIFVSNSIYSQITVVDAVAIDGDKNGAYGTVEIEFSIAVHDGDIKDPGDRDDWEFSLDPEFASFLTPTAFNTKVSYIAVDIDGNDEFIQFTFDTEFASSNGPIYFRYTQEGDVVWDQATESTSFLSDFSLLSASDNSSPAINNVTSNAAGVGVLKLGESIIFTVDIEGPFDETDITILPPQYNGGDLNWVTYDGGDTYTGTYIVAEGHSDRLTAWPLIDINAVDIYGNISDSLDVTNIEKTIDANTPGISSVTVVESLGSILLVDSIIEFTVTLSTAAETGLTVSPSTYNGRALNWATLDAG